MSHTKSTNIRLPVDMFEYVDKKIDCREYSCRNDYFYRLVLRDMDQHKTTKIIERLVDGALEKRLYSPENAIFLRKLFDESRGTDAD